MSPLKSTGKLKLTRCTLGSWLCALACAGTISICFGQAPPNDNFANAIPLAGDAITFSGTLSNATHDAGETRDTCPGYYGLAGGSVWWTWMATNATDVLVELLAPQTGAYDARFSVHTGTTPANLVSLGCNFMGFPSNRYIVFSATAGTTYYIRVGGAAGPFALRLTATNGPVVLSAPEGRTIEGDSSVAFNVVAAGLPPLRYQWQFMGNALAGQTKPILILHDLGTNQAGGYSVVVSNSTGATTSSVAQLAVSPPSPLPLLAALSPVISNHFHFSLTGGVVPDYYLIQSSTNLHDWGGEPELPGSSFYNHEHGYPSNMYNKFFHTNLTAIFSIPRDANQKFLRVLPNLLDDACIAQQAGINVAIKLFAIEGKHNAGMLVTEADVVGYLKGDVVCPLEGTTFANSYTLTTVSAATTCQKDPVAHVLP